jgi:hypothetical protein
MYVTTGFSEGLAVVQTGWNLQYGWMDTTGHVVALAVGDEARDFHCGRAWVQSSGGKWTAVDRGGYEKIRTKFDAVDNFADGIAAVGIATMTDPGDEEEPPTFDWKFGFVDTSGNYLISPDCQAVHGFAEGRAAVRRNSKWGFIDRSGNTVIPPQYEEVGQFSGGLAGVQISGKCGCINRAGTLVVPATYEGMRSFAEGLVPVAQDGKWGYMDTTGRLVVPLTFADAQLFSEGLAPVKVGEKWGYVDRTGKLMIPAEFTGVSDFRMGLASATKEQ